MPQPKKGGPEGAIPGGPEADKLFNALANANPEVIARCLQNSSPSGVEEREGLVRTWIFQSLIRGAQGLPRGFDRTAAALSNLLMQRVVWDALKLGKRDKEVSASFAVAVGNIRKTKFTDVAGLLANIHLEKLPEEKPTASAPQETPPDSN